LANKTKSCILNPNKKTTQVDNIREMQLITDSNTRFKVNCSQDDKISKTQWIRSVNSCQTK